MNHQELYYELSLYTLAHPDSAFIHQHIVDAYAAQNTSIHTKPITLFFALAGLYLFSEEKYTGKMVQKAHMQMAQKPKKYPNITLPQQRGTITVKEVLQAPAGKKRDIMISQWCKEVWKAFESEHQKIISSTRTFLDFD